MIKPTTPSFLPRPGGRRALLLAAAVVFAAGALARSGAGAAATPLATGAPEVLVLTVSNEVLDEIRADKALRSGDIGKLNALVDRKVLPYVDFDKMTRLAVGRPWRQASPEQRAALVREFRALLTTTYSGAMSQVSDHRVELRPSRAAPTETDLIVRTQVVASKGEPIQLDYRMEKTDAGWKIYDLNILGVWIIENYRNAFASEINAGGIDGLIKSLADKNKKLAARS